MDHREFIKSLSAEQRRELTSKSNAEGFKALVLHWGLIALLGCLIALKVPYWFVLLPLQGVLIVFLFTLMHETIHRTVFESPKTNDVVAWVCSVLLVLPATWFREFHMAHHRHTQDEEKDPELSTAKPQTMAQYLWHVTGVPVWWSQLLALFRNALGRFDYAYVPSSKITAVRNEARVLLAIYIVLFIASLVAGSTLLLTIWIIPAILGQPFLRLYLLAEHGRCPLVANAFQNTRTTFTNAAVRKLAWNMPYHSEHHAYPMVPFHKLADLHELVKQHLSVTNKSYTTFNRQYLKALGSDRDN